MGKHDIKVGDWVMLTDAKLHEQIPRWYPAAGTVGKVTKDDKDVYRVQWPDGSTSGNGNWFVPRYALIRAEAPDGMKEGSTQDEKA